MKGDVVNAVCCGYIEHVFDDKANWKILKIAFSKDDIRAMKWIWDYNYNEKSEKFISDALKFWDNHKI